MLIRYQIKFFYQISNILDISGIQNLQFRLEKNENLPFLLLNEKGFILEYL
jgi:hypothetical protein